MALVAAAEVPVGEAKIVDGTLVTQPSPGVFKGFAARCTHAGCALAVKNGGIECPCHGSKFKLDGSVARGPATEPLVARPVTVRGGEIVAG
jgi:Rieske Fe-S protein